MARGEYATCVLGERLANGLEEREIDGQRARGWWRLAKLRMESWLTDHAARLQKGVPDTATPHGPIKRESHCHCRNPVTTPASSSAPKNLPASIALARLPSLPRETIPAFTSNDAPPMLSYPSIQPAASR
uniref:Uncharacterized protein n=1 Tax=Oryza glumipatula TaxID=40148 RepID=A0A0E0AKF5_9ORYZ